QSVIYIIYIWIVVVSQSTDPDFNVCPDRQSFEPCKCNDLTREIRCGPGFSMPVNVLYLFRESTPSMMSNS
ncbi:hypothetical protein BLA29_011824, partial [Euroglyphus maynei]